MRVAIPDNFSIESHLRILDLVATANSAKIKDITLEEMPSDVSACILQTDLQFAFRIEMEGVLSLQGNDALFLPLVDRLVRDRWGENMAKFLDRAAVVLEHLFVVHSAKAYRKAWVVAT
jgi:hypothetical protein